MTCSLGRKRPVFEGWGPTAENPMTEITGIGRSRMVKVARGEIRWMQ